MPNQRAPGQKLLPIAVDEKFLRELDAGLVQAGYRNRSQFIRDAIIEKLLRAKVPLSKDVHLPPRRTGKRAGPGNAQYPPHRATAYELNDQAGSASGTTGAKSGKPPRKATK